jgi:hypothetical protein
MRPPLVNLLSGPTNNLAKSTHQHVATPFSETQQCAKLQITKGRAISTDHKTAYAEEQQNKRHATILNIELINL